MTKLLYATSAAALLTMVGVTPSLAQSDTTTTASSGTLPTTTCRDISSMDQEAAKGVFYYMAGLHKGMGGSSSQASAGSSTTGSSTSSSTASSGTTASGSADAGDTTASTTTPDTTTSASGSSDTSGTSGSTDTTASNTTGTSGSSSTSGSATTGSGSSSMTVAGLPEFSMINIDQLMAACQQSPDMQVSQVISQQMGTSGSAQ